MRHEFLGRMVLAGVAVGLVAPPAFGQEVPVDLSNQDRPMPSEMARERRQQQYVQGKVVFDDGTAAPPNVTIERVCGAAKGVPQAVTDPKGRFTIEMGRLTGIAPDASQGFQSSGAPGEGGSELTSLSDTVGQDFEGRLGNDELTGCSLQAVLPGFISTSVTLGPGGRFDNPDVGDLVLTPQGGAEGLSLSIVSLRAPEEARESFEKGMLDFNAEKWGGARKHLKKAVEIYPEHAEAWFALGRIYERDKKPKDARESFEKAVAADPRYVPPLIGLARLDAGEAQWDDVAERADQVLALNPNDFSEGYFYGAVADFNRKRYPAAEKNARKAIEMGAETRFPQVVHLLAMSLGYQGQVEPAIEELKRYLEIAPDSKAARQQLEGLENYLAQQGRKASQ